MSSNAVKINKSKPKSKTTKMIPQSLPAHFYKNYKPPATPTINPMKAPTNLEQLISEFKPLPKQQNNAKGIDVKSGSSYSMKRNQHPMSMPIRHGIMGPNRPFAHINTTNTNDDILKEQKENKDEPHSLEKSIKSLKVGSYTCLQMMGTPLKAIDDIIEPEAAVSATSGTASTFDDKQSFEAQAEEPGDEDDDD
eukprot:255351_1